MAVWVTHEETMAQQRQAWRETAPAEDKARLRAELEAQMAEFLAKGGRISAGVSQRLQAIPLQKAGATSTARKWKQAPTPRSAIEADILRKRYGAVADDPE